MIAHRLPTIVAMASRVVLNDGAIAEIGAYAALLAQCGLYATLRARKVSGFMGIEEDME
jgi:ABC-type multidrug transport system fused ATPase/permease subunit